MGRRRIYGPDAKCKIEGCDNSPRANWLCGKHIKRLKTHGDPLVVKRRGKPAAPNITCRVPGCESQSRARGLCWKHYRRELRGVPLDDVEREPLICSVDGCGQLAKSRGFCPRHYYRFRTYGDPLHVTLVRATKHDPQDIFNTIPKGHQRCNECLEIKPLCEFGETKRRDGTRTARGKCRDCHSRMMLDNAHGEGAWVWKQQRLAENDGKCGLCGSDSPHTKTGWHLDHDHETGEWRDVLCQRCNIARGYVDDGWDVDTFAKKVKKPC